jgi:hypothetical protein
LDSNPNTTFTVQIFPNPQGEDEGRTFVAQTTATTDKEGKASFGLILAQPLGAAQNVTATATDPGGNTSEFSAPRTAGSTKK